MTCPPAPSSGARNENSQNQHRTLIAQASNTTDLDVINDVSSLNSSTEELRKKGIVEKRMNDVGQEDHKMIKKEVFDGGGEKVKKTSRIGSFFQRKLFGKK